MNCGTYQSLILDYLEGALPPEGARQLKAHVAGCPACQIELMLAQKIEGALSGRRLRMPPEHFTARVLAAVAEKRVLAGTFWSQMLPPTAYAASILALILGLSRYFPYLSNLYETWSDRLETLALILGLRGVEAAEEPSRVDALLQSLRETAASASAYLSVYREEISWLYTSHASTVHLAIAALALVWMVYDYRQGARG